jgi:hypothetical protein
MAPPSWNLAACRNDAGKRKSRLPLRRDQHGIPAPPVKRQGGVYLSDDRPPSMAAYGSPFGEPNRYSTH